jgi:hypothetical protein
MNKILFWLFFAKIRMATCIPEVNKSGFEKNRSLFTFSKIGKLPIQINESSGLANIKSKNTFLTHNDGGGFTELYEIDSLGNLISTMPIPFTKNNDWEDLASDENNHVFIGDFGNNTNIRTDLTIYKIDLKSEEKPEIITFNFGDQKDFPPTKESLNFDCEAMFFSNDSLYLFSKNRGEKHTKLYVLPSKPGNYTVLPKASIYLKASITAADISPNGKQYALLSYGKVFLFEISDGRVDFSMPQYCIKAPMKQSEAITYMSDNELLITNEQGDIFKMILKKSGGF